VTADESEHKFTWNFKPGKSKLHNKNITEEQRKKTLKYSKNKKRSVDPKIGKNFSFKSPETKSVLKLVNKNVCYLLIFSKRRPRRDLNSLHQVSSFDL
jgi:hypothetical protein